MTHDEARELFTARIDDALDADVRARLDAHLAGCTDCRRELDGLVRTVALLRRARPVHAPAGFAERVISAARPGRRQRLARALLHPWRVMLPLQAAAVLLVAVTVGLLYRGEPELQDAARPPASAREATGSRRDEPFAPRAEGPTSRHGAPVGEEERQVLDRAPADAPASEDTRGRLARPPSAPAAPAETPAAPTGRTAPAAPARQEARARDDVVRAQVTAADREQAVRDVAALVVRLGGTVLARHDEPAGVVLELALPAGAWDTVAGELARHGRLRVDSGPAPSGPLRARLRIGD